MKGLQRMTKAELIRRIRALERPAPALGDGRLRMGAKVGNAKLEKQTRERRVTRSSPNSSRDRYADLYDFAPVGYVTLDDQGVILELNLTAAKLFGRERTRMLGRPLPLHVVREDLAALRGHLAALATPEPQPTVELRLIQAGTEGLPVMMQSVRVYDVERKTHLCRAALTDLTGSRQAEAALQRSADLNRSILSSLSAQIAVLDGGGKIIAVNEAWIRFGREHGLESGSGAGVGADYLHICRVSSGPGEVEARTALEGIQAVLDRSIPSFTYEYPCDAPRGRLWFLMTVMPLAAAGDGVVVSHLDITARRQTELALAENETRLRAILDTAVEGIITIDERGLIESFNPAAENLFGYTAGEVIGRNVSLLMPSPDREAHDGYLARYRETGVRRVIGVGREVMGRRKDGSVFPIDLSVGEARPGGRRSFTGIIRDLTKRKESEAALRVSERSLRMLSRAMEQSPVSVLITEPSGEIIYVNPKFTEVTGYSSAEVLGKNPRLLKSGEQPPEFYRDLWATIMAGRDWRGEFSNRKKDGERFWEYAVIAPIQDEHGILTHFVALKEDITARKQAEAALLASNRRMQRVLEVETVGVMFWNLATGVMIDANGTFLRTMGYSRQELEAGKLTWQKLTPPEYMEVSRGELRKFAVTGRVGPYEKEYFRKDGSRHWFVFAGSVLDDGTCVEFCVDISRCKQTEETLRQRNEELQAVLETLPAYVWVAHDAGCRVITGNRAVNEMAGVAAGTNVSQTMVATGQATYLCTVKPDGTEFLPEELPLQHAIATRRPVRGQTLELRFPDGRRIQSVCDAVPLFDADGKVRGAVAVSFDITERKMLEEALIDVSERERRKFGHELHDGLGQRLTGLEMLSHALAEELRNNDQGLAERARRLNAELRDTVTEARLISHGLAPVPLDGDGLMRGLGELASRTCRHKGVKCRFHCESPVLVENPSVATHLYRIAQEAVANALKHGKAKRIGIHLTENGGELILCVENNGRPLPVTERNQNGLGLNAMRYRAGLIGGSLTVESGKRTGVKVACTLRRKYDPQEKEP